MIIQSDDYVQDPLASVIIITYNQESYINQAIDSILSQKCDFPYEIIIAEDYGTDGTREICKEYQKKYPERIKLLLQDSNQGLMRNYRDVMGMSRGKYIAQCAGDDYWHNPEKLKLQVDFLENNTDYGIVHSDFDELNESTGKLLRNSYRSRSKVIPTGDVFKQLFISYHIHTLTACFKKELFDKYVPFQRFIDLDFTAEDRLSYNIMAKYTKVGYLSDSTSTYRRIQGSISSPINFKTGENYYNRWFEQSMFLFEMFPDELIFDEKVERTYIYNAILSVAFKAIDFQEARKYADLLRKYDVINMRVKFSRNRLSFYIFVIYKRIIRIIQTLMKR